MQETIETIQKNTWELIRIVLTEFRGHDRVLSGNGPSAPRLSSALPTLLRFPNQFSLALLNRNAYKSATTEFGTAAAGGQNGGRGNRGAVGAA